MKYEKGSVVWYQGIFYVVVSVVTKNIETYVNCVCDNANNIYAFKTTELRDSVVLCVRDVVQYQSFGTADDMELWDKLMNIGRPIPINVIAEVLVGLHDDRFDHWYKT
jgi:hypothetical protein